MKYPKYTVEQNRCCKLKTKDRVDLNNDFSSLVRQGISQRQAIFILCKKYDVSFSTVYYWTHPKHREWLLRWHREHPQPYKRAKKGFWGKFVARKKTILPEFRKYLSEVDSKYKKKYRKTAQYKKVRKEWENKNGNKEKILKAKRIWIRNKYHSDPIFRQKEIDRRKKQPSYKKYLRKIQCPMNA